MAWPQVSFSKEVETTQVLLSAPSQWVMDTQPVQRQQARHSCHKTVLFVGSTLSPQEVGWRRVCVREREREVIEYYCGFLEGIISFARFKVTTDV